MSLILATQEVEINRTTVQGQPRQNVCETPPQVTAGHDGTCLSSQVHGELEIG
jgi:hypothetical protein